MAAEPALVMLVGEERTPLPCDDVRIYGDVLVAVLDGRERRWGMDHVHSVKWLGCGPVISRSRTHSSKPPGIDIDTARAQFRRRPSWLSEER